MKYTPRTRIEVIRLPNELAKIEVVGWSCQDRLRAHQTGVPISVFSKVLANVIFEANHTSAFEERLPSHRVSPFMSLWTPHRFGAIFSIPDRLLSPSCETRTGRAYLKDFAKDHELANAIGLQLLPQPGTKDTDQDDTQPPEAYPQTTPESTRVKFDINPSSRIRRWETEGIMSREEYEDLQDLTAIFAEIYTVKAEALNAFATCRTRDSTITAIDTELVHCKADIESILAKSWGPGIPSLEANINGARACVHQITTKDELYGRIGNLASQVAPRLKPFRLGSAVLGHLGSPTTCPELEARKELQPFFLHLTNLVVSCLALLECYKTDVDPHSCLRTSAAYLLREWSSPINVRTLTGAAGSKLIGRLRAELEGIVDACWRELERRKRASIPSVTVWYQTLENAPFAKLF